MGEFKCNYKKKIDNEKANSGNYLKGLWPLAIDNNCPMAFNVSTVLFKSSELSKYSYLIYVDGLFLEMTSNQSFF